MESHWDGGTKVCSRGLGHMTKMATTPIHGKNPKSLLIWRRDNILLADFRILTICIINLYILQGFFFLGFNLCIDSTNISYFRDM